jgi:redox-sensitive bicupin YhaK (pirin superfamily)
VHHAENELPVLDGEGKKCVRVIAGDLYGTRSPLAVFSDTLYAGAARTAGGRLEVPSGYRERAIYIADQAGTYAQLVPDSGGVKQEPGNAPTALERQIRATRHNRARARRANATAMGIQPSYGSRSAKRPLTTH